MALGASLPPGRLLGTSRGLTERSASQGADIPWPPTRKGEIRTGQEARNRSEAGAGSRSGIVLQTGAKDLKGSRFSGATEGFSARKFQK